MHSTQFTALAQAADMNGWTIVAMCDIPASQGTYPAAWVIIERDYRAPIDYAVTMGVVPDEADREAFFTSSTYDLTREKAQKLFEQKCANEIRKAA